MRPEVASNVIFDLIIAKDLSICKCWGLSYVDRKIPFAVGNVVFMSLIGIVVADRRKSKEESKQIGSEGLRSKSAAEVVELSCRNPLELLEESQKQLIEQLVAYQEMFEVPSESDLVAFSVCIPFLCFLQFK